MSKAVRRLARVSAIIRVELSGVITAPFGNQRSSAAMLASPFGATLTRVVGFGFSPACLSKPKLPIYAPPLLSTTMSLHQ